MHGHQKTAFPDREGMNRIRWQLPVLDYVPKMAGTRNVEVVVFLLVKRCRQVTPEGVGIDELDALAFSRQPEAEVGNSRRFANTTLLVDDDNNFERIQ